MARGWHHPTRPRARLWLIACWDSCPKVGWLPEVPALHPVSPQAWEVPGALGCSAQPLHSPACGRNGSQTISLGPAGEDLLILWAARGLSHPQFPGP